MPISYFHGKTHPQPTEDELRAALGAAFPLWQRLTRFIEVDLGDPGAWDPGGQKYGWNRWYRKGGKALANLYPQEGGLVAQVVLGRAQVEQALALELGAVVGRMVRETPLFHDGMWLFIPVRTEEETADVEKLLRLKRPAKKSPSK